jgi:nitrate reductase NapAB chaperone NapD
VPIKSYLAYPEPGRSEELAGRLRAFPECEVTPSTTHDLLIVVTDTASDEREKALEDALAQVEGLLCLALVSGAEPDLIQIDLEKQA